MSAEACSRCDGEAVLEVAYSGQHLCEEHLVRSVERRVRRRIRTDGLFDGREATWLVGLSGGKDSAVLATILRETFADNPKVHLRALCVHEGIEGYRDESLAAARTLADRLGIDLETRTYRDLYGLGMDEVADLDPLGMAPCAYCGVFRRDALERHAGDVDADLLLTGHNLDDEAQTAMMNFLEGDLAQIAKHYEASLAPLDERDDPGPFVPRAKPLRDVPEKEVALYAHLRGLPAHMASCPHATAAFRGELQSLLHGLEADHPGTRHSIMAGYEELGGIVADRYRGTGAEKWGTCSSCGRPAGGDRCRACELRSTIEAAKSV